MHGWEYVSVNVTEREAPRALVAGSEIRLEFRGGMFTATAGCNSMGGPYRLAEGRLWLPENVGMTILGCAPGGWEQDVWLQDFLRSRPVAITEADRLVLDNGVTRIELAIDSACPPGAQGETCVFSTR